MSITTLMPLISAILVLFLGFLVLRKNYKERVNFTFTLFTITVSIWMFGTFMMFLNKDDINKVVFWDKFVYVGVVFIPVVMYHFGLALTAKKRNFLLILGYVLSTFFLCTLFTDYFVKDAFIYKWGAHSRAQIFHHLFLIYFAAYIISWFFVVYKYYKSNIYFFDKERIKYCFIAFFFLATIGPLAYLPAYGFSIYPFSYISGVIFSVIMAYAIIVHHLMDVKLVMRKYSVFLTTLITIIGFIFVVKYISDTYLLFLSSWVDFLLLLFGIFLFPYIKIFYYHKANKYFFSSLYDSAEVIAGLSDKLRSTLSIETLYNYIYESLNNALHLKAFAIVGNDEKTNKFYIRYNQGFEVGSIKFLEGDKKLHAEYISKNKPIIIDDLITGNNDEKTKKLVDLLKGLKVEMITPLNVKNKTIGLLALGQKESNDAYNDEDSRMLEVIGAQAAIAIENAMLYEEARLFNIKLEKEVERATKELRSANVKLKKLDESKSEFISIASHQLRTPLTVIKGYVSMILEGSFGKIPAVQRDSLTKVYLSNERLINLVENLLNLSRIESGRLQFKYETMNLETVVASVVEELSGKAKEKKLKLEFKHPAKPLPRVTIDQEKIRQVVMNLIDNAIKYTNKGSVTVAVRQAENNIEFSVADSGMGIDPSDLPHLFQKFQRGTGTFLVHTEGTGLGLYVAREMIEMHKGKIWAESNGQGRGSKFIVTIPINATVK